MTRSTQTLDEESNRGPTEILEIRVGLSGDAVVGSAYLELGPHSANERTRRSNHADQAMARNRRTGGHPHAFGAAGAALAQDTGNIFGTVSDTDGSALPGVTITLAGYGATQLQVTDSNGGFRFLGLDPGAWQLKAELEGFSPSSIRTLSYLLTVIQRSC